MKGRSAARCLIGRWLVTCATRHRMGQRSIRTRSESSTRRSKTTSRPSGERRSRGPRSRRAKRMSLRSAPDCKIDLARGLRVRPRRGAPRARAPPSDDQASGAAAQADRRGRLVRLARRRVTACTAKLRTDLRPRIDEEATVGRPARLERVLVDDAHGWTAVERHGVQPRHIPHPVPPPRSSAPSGDHAGEPRTSSVLAQRARVHRLDGHDVERSRVCRAPRRTRSRRPSGEIAGAPARRGARWSSIAPSRRRRRASRSRRVAPSRLRTGARRPEARRTAVGGRHRNGGSRRTAARPRPGPSPATGSTSAGSLSARGGVRPRWPRASCSVRRRP